MFSFKKKEREPHTRFKKVYPSIFKAQNNKLPDEKIYFDFQGKEKQCGIFKNYIQACFRDVDSMYVRDRNSH